MIAIKRSAAPAILSSPEGKGKKETTAALLHYSGASAAETFDFKVYRDPEVKDALIELFNEKCAYCESAFRHVYSGDVEHFRPKGEITEAAAPNKPGYYWLAADWENLLLSCRNCNQKLTHAMAGETNKITLGKMNQFPLKNGGRHARVYLPDGTALAAEEPFRLLLNPCTDPVEEHFRYGPEGIIVSDTDEGQTSIKVYVLQRVPLVQAREKVLIAIQAQMTHVNDAVLHYNAKLTDHDSALKFFYERRLQVELARLKSFLGPKEEYLGMARQVIGEFLKTNFDITL